MLATGNIRNLVILIDKKLGLKYLDFSKETVDALGLESSIANGHQSSGYELEVVLNSLSITSQDTIIDLGAGKGGALLLMANYPFSKIVGVELSPEFTVIAKRNITRLGRRRRITVICGDASQYESIDDFNYVYLFNPFPDPVMIRVLENIKESLKNRPRDLTIIYTNPKCENLLLAGEFFKKTDEYFFENKDSTVIYTFAKKGSDAALPARLRKVQDDRLAATA